MELTPDEDGVAFDTTRNGELHLGIYDRPPGQSIPMSDSATLGESHLHDGSTVLVRRRRRRLPGSDRSLTGTTAEPYKRDMHWSNAYGAQWPRRTAHQVGEPKGKWSECERCQEGDEEKDFIFSQKWGLGDFTGREVGGLRSQRIRKGADAAWDVTPKEEEEEPAPPTSSMVAPEGEPPQQRQQGEQGEQGAAQEEGEQRGEGQPERPAAGEEEEGDCWRDFCPVNLYPYLAHQWYLIGLGYEVPSITEPSLNLNSDPNPTWLQGNLRDP